VQLTVALARAFLFAFSGGTELYRRDTGITSQLVGITETAKAI